MWDNFVGQQARRGTRNLLIFNAIILICVLIAMYFSSRYYFNFLLGPFATNPADLSNISDPDRTLRYYVTVDAEQVLETGIRHKKDVIRRGRKVGEKVVSRDLLLVFGDNKAIVVEFDPQAMAQKRVSGTLERFPNATTYRFDNPGNFRKDLKILPVLLEATGFRMRGWIGLAVMVPLTLIAVINLVRGVRRWADPSQHPLIRQLEQYGDPAEVSERIEEEWQSDEKDKIGPVTLTRMWCIHPHSFGMTLVHLGEAVWVYKAATKHYHNGIPTGTTYSAVLSDNRGVQHTFGLRSEPLVDEFVEAVVHRVPWIFQGHDDDLAQLWKGNKETFYRLLEEQRLAFVEELRNETRRDDDGEVQDVLPA